MGMKVYLYDVVTRLPLGNAVQVPTLKELMQTCDVVSLHVPQTPQTDYMIDAEAISSAILVTRLLLGRRVVRAAMPSTDRYPPMN
jgi:phosphoglycerate dehydrogenase-like enzyme